MIGLVPLRGKDAPLAHTHTHTHTHTHRGKVTRGNRENSAIGKTGRGLSPELTMLAP